MNDAIIAVTSVHNNCKLLTNDKNLINKMKSFGYAYITEEDLNI